MDYILLNSFLILKPVTSASLRELEKSQSPTCAFDKTKVEN
jgi:hypothetical protein